jgi:hypothetical protein
MECLILIDLDGCVRHLSKSLDVTLLLFAYEDMLTARLWQAAERICPYHGCVDCSGTYWNVISLQ